MLTRTLFRFIHRAAQLSPGLSSAILGWYFTKMSFTIPAKRLAETKTLIAFYHPRPAYNTHILIVPKQAVSSLASFSPAAQEQFLVELFSTVQSVVSEFDLESQGYRLILNGGRFQDLPQMHFHLISGEEETQGHP